MARSFPATLVRGGTSKGLFVDPVYLPGAGPRRDAILSAALGSPDPTRMQLDGVGGGISSTSKVALINKSSRPHVDANYLFGQVHLTKSSIDWSGSCANLAAGVAVYSRHINLISNDQSVISIWQENSNSLIKCHFMDNFDPVTIPGLPRPCPPIFVEFFPSSQTPYSLLPDNQPIHQLWSSNLKKHIPATLIIGGNPTVIVAAEDVGLFDFPPSGDWYRIHELAMNELRQEGSNIMRIKCEDSLRLAMIGSARDYRCPNGEIMQSTVMDLVSCITTEARIHHAHTGSGAVNIACAAYIPGTIPHHILQGRATSYGIRLGHPSGVMTVKAGIEKSSSGVWSMISSGFIRTARILFDGTVFHDSVGL